MNFERVIIDAVLCIIFTFLLIYCISHPLTPLCKVKLITITEKNISFDNLIRVNTVLTNEGTYLVPSNNVFENLNIGFYSCYICNNTIVSIK